MNYKFSFFFFFLFISFSLSAEEIVITEYCSYSSCQYRSSTPAAVANAYIANLNAGQAGYSCPFHYSLSHIEEVDSTLYRAYISYSVACNSNTGSSTYTIKAVTRTITCELPLVWDSDAGECRNPPKEICYTDLEQNADSCVLIGDDDPNDELPSGCVLDTFGRQVCLTDDPNCYNINGQQACALENSVCGWSNGTYGCVQPELEGCGYFNGERICFTPDGEKVDKDSPDHPDNGGNLDGDDTNDPKDSRPPEDGGNENNQPGIPEGLASEKTSQGMLNELKNIGKTLKDIKNAPGVQSPGGSTGGGSTPGEGDSEIDFSPIIDETSTSEALNNAKSEMDTASDSAISELDTVADGIGDAGPMSTNDMSGVTSGVLGIFGGGQCSELILGTQDLNLTISCSDIQKIKDLLGFILYAFTAWRLFEIVTRQPASAKV